MRHYIHWTGRQLLFVSASVFFLAGTSYAQVYSDYSNDPQESGEYPYLLPIWGKKVQEKGFELPLST
ncbi:MAG TPA: hypothetical protein VLL47_02980, partial [Robiginitalea sp.]|nr:hypothetical protein [Robiginitalea sp.]